jgi:cytochrome bd-I ubiquinol oxidase subunit X
LIFILFIQKYQQLVGVPFGESERVELEVSMWYFAWILGVLLACAFGIINVMWMETEEMLGSDKDS